MNQIAAVLQEGLSLWKTFIATREGAYKRSMDKRLRTAVNAGESYIFTDEDTSLTDKKKAQLKAHYRKRFFANNN